jgi:hypothetical protein
MFVPLLLQILAHYEWYTVNPVFEIKHFASEWSEAAMPALRPE